MLTLHSTSAYTLRDVRVYSDSGGQRKIIASQSELEPGRNFNISPGSRDLKNILITYTTHRGLDRKDSFDLSAPMLAPDTFHFDRTELILKPNSSGQCNLLVVNSSREETQAVVSIKSPSNNVTIVPPSRNVYMKPGQSANVPFTIKASGKTAAPVILVARLNIKSSLIPFKAILPIIAK